MTDLRPVIGIDPSNTSAGLALVAPDGAVVASTTVRVWRPQSITSAVARLVDAWLPGWHSPLVLLEEPAAFAGDKRRRSGSPAILVAGGMVLGEIVRRFGCRRTDVTRVKPDEWRKGAPSGPARPKDSDAWKAWALAEVQSMGLEVSSADEAEAILIATYGWATQKGGVCDG